MAKVYIDLGHGGRDPGAVGKHSKESENVLKVGLELAKLLRSSGHSVKLSRTTDVYLTLTQRTNDANAWGADIFVSLHNNAASSASATGFETFIYNGSVSSNTPKLQNAIHDAIISEIGVRDRGKKRANFAVVRQSRMPAVLIEYAFITNINDEEILMNEVNKLARITAKGINDYFGINGSSAKVSSTPPKNTSKSKANSKSKTSKVPKANLKVDGKWGKSTTRALQRALGTPVDGIISRQYNNATTRSLYGNTVSYGSGGSMVIRALQRKVGAKADGYLGPETARRLQRYLGTPVDGVISRPSSLMVRELQRRLNNGSF